VKKYIAGVLLIVCIVLASMLYKQKQVNVFHGFRKAVPSQKSEPVLYLYGFFSGDSCMPCGEVIGVLNELPDYFQVTGIVPRGESARIGFLKEKYQIRFPVHSVDRYGRYKPLVNPTIIGATANGRILFVLPCPSLRPEEIRKFLMDFHLKLAPYLADPSF
jgi:hypothetical protein